MLLHRGTGDLLRAGRQGGVLRCHERFLLRVPLSARLDVRLYR